MKSNILLAASCLTILMCTDAFSQSLTRTDGEASLSKFAAKNGRFAGTYVIDGGGARAFYLYAGKKKEVMMDAYDFDANGGYVNTSEGMTNMAELGKKFDVEVQNDEESNWSLNENVLLIRTDLIGRMVVDKGRIKKEYDYDFKPPFFTGYEYSSSDKLKPDVRMRPAGYVPIGETVKGINVTDGGIKKVVKGTSEETLLMESASVMVSGIITEKISIKNPSPYNNNRLACQIFNGNGLTLKSEKIYELPFAGVNIASTNVNGDLGILYSTLQAPTTVKPSSTLNMKGEKKKYMMYVRVDKDANLVDSVRWKSTSVRGMFNMFPHNDDVYVLGMVKDGHGGYYRWDVGSVTHLQITKLSGGKRVNQQLISVEDLESKAKGPAGAKMKFKLSAKAPAGKFRFNGMHELKNGDLLITGQSMKEYFAIQISTAGDLKGYYQIGRIDEAFHMYDYQVIPQKNSVLFVIMEQPGDVVQGAHYKHTRHTSRVVRIDDVYTKGRVVRLDPSTQTLSNQEDIGGKKYFMVGSNPCRMSNDESQMFFTGTDRKKTLHMISLK